MLPNPTSEKVTFSLQKVMLQTIQLFDVRGRLVTSEENISSNEKTISVQTLNPGIYFAKITSVKGQTTVKKIIVQ